MVVNIIGEISVIFLHDLWDEDGVSKLAVIKSADKVYNGGKVMKDGFKR